MHDRDGFPEKPYSILVIEEERAFAIAVHGAYWSGPVEERGVRGTEQAIRFIEWVGVGNALERFFGRYTAYEDEDGNIFLVFALSDIEEIPDGPKMPEEDQCIYDRVRMRLKKVDEWPRCQLRKDETPSMRERIWPSASPAEKFIE
jgi:hypothetical protein